MPKYSGSRPQMLKVAKSFDRRREAALRKVHLPTEEDLIYGMPFYGGTLDSDVREFAARTLLVARSLGLTPLNTALNELSMSASPEGVEELSAALECATTSNNRSRVFLDRVQLRCRIYLAAWGQTIPLTNLAMETINAAFNEEYYGKSNPEAYVHLIFQSLELLASATGHEDFQTYLPGNRIVQLNDPDTNILRTRGIRQRVQRRIAELQDDEKNSSAPSQPIAPRPESETGLTNPGGDGIIVIENVGNQKTTEGKVARDYVADILGRAIPVLIGRGLSSVHSSLVAEFPHAESAVDALLLSLAEGRSIRFLPTIIVGDPGSGKSYFCRRLLECLCLPYTMIPYAGVADSALIGTARRYSTGEPSLPVSTLVTHRIANPGLILDEVDKASTGKHNGNAIDAMLPMLEQTTASAYQDPYLQAPADISQINWIMTANTVSPLSKPFRDRCRIVRFPPPERRFINTYISNIMPRLAERRGQSVEMFSLAPAHLSALQNWTDGSLRTLTKMLESIMDEHEATGRRLAN